MRALRAWIARLGGLFGRRRRDEEMSEEMESHLQMHIEDNSRAGMTPQEARRQALIKLGGMEQAKESYRERRGMPWLETLWQDIRYGLRTLRKSPGFTAVVVLTLALGIGANTAIFSFIDAVMLRSMPVKDPQHLAMFRWTAHTNPKYHGYSSHGDCANERSGSGCSFSAPLFQAMSAHATLFSGVAAFSGPGQFDFSGNGPATIARGEFVSGEFFSTMGVTPFIGRTIGPSDDSATAPPVIVLDYGYWQHAFGGDPAAVGRTVQLNGTPALIVGVADPHFTHIAPGKPEDFFVPLSLVETVKPRYWVHGNVLTDARQWWVVMVGRLKTGVSIGRAQAEATTIFRNEMIHGATPLSKESDGPAISLAPAQEGLSGERADIGPMLNVMMFAVGLVLLIACANVAGLMLARSATRQREMAVRLALGAGRTRITRQLLTESILLSVIGGVLGVFAAIWGVKAVIGLLGGYYGEAFPFAVSLDGRVLLFTVGITFATGILFGLAPALRGTRVDLTPALKGAASVLPGGGSHGDRWLRLGDLLVVGQVALSIVVLVGAGLLVRTLRNLQGVNPGFDTENVLLFGVEPSLAGYKDAQTAQLYRSLQDRFRALPGVISASYSSNALLSGDLDGTEVHLDGAPPKSNVESDTLAIGPDFFSTMSIPVLSGRAFTTEDYVTAAATGAAQEAATAEAARKASPSSVAPAQAGPGASARAATVAPVPVIINETFARKFFPNKNPIGKHIGDFAGDTPVAPWQPGYTVVGVAGDTKYNNVRRAIHPVMFEPLTAGGASFELRTTGDPTALVKAVRDIVFQSDSNLPILGMRTQTEQIAQMLSEPRLMSQLSSFFALAALVLSCIGLYGLLAYEVARRTREIGIRLALGAQRSHVVRLVVRQGLALTFMGTAIGTGAALGVTRYIAAMLYDVKANDPATIIGVAILLTAVALAACLIPARRAMRVDPMVALRYE